jgi:hypothetical protein
MGISTVVVFDTPRIFPRGNTGPEVIVTKEVVVAVENPLVVVVFRV